MDMAADHSLKRELDALLGWWREAGVDQDFADDATVWLTEPEVAADTAAPAQPTNPALARKAEREAKKSVDEPPFGGDPANWPNDLAGFRSWWLESDTLDTGGRGPRIAPRGEAGAELLVIVPQPEESDSEKLLTGPQGKLLGNILRAIGIAGDKTYLATALPRHQPLPDWRALQARELGKILAHHVSLVQPQRILAFGRCIPPLLGHDTAQGSVSLQEFNHVSGTTPSAFARELESLLGSAGERRRFWRGWLNWTDQDT